MNKAPLKIGQNCLPLLEHVRKKSEHLTLFSQSMNNWPNKTYNTSFLRWYHRSRQHKSIRWAFQLFNLYKDSSIVTCTTSYAIWTDHTGTICVINVMNPFCQIAVNLKQSFILNRVVLGAQNRETVFFQLAPILKGIHFFGKIAPTWQPHISVQQFW